MLEKQTADLSKEIATEVYVGARALLVGDDKSNDYVSGYSKACHDVIGIIKKFKKEAEAGAE